MIERDSSLLFFGALDTISTEIIRKYVLRGLFILFLFRKKSVFLRDRQKQTNKQTKD